VPLAKVHITI